MKLLSEDKNKVVLQIGLAELGALQLMIYEFMYQLNQGTGYWREEKTGNRFLKVTKDCKTKTWVNDLSIDK